MSKKEVTALPQQSRPQEPSPTPMIPAKPPAVKCDLDLAELRSSKNLQAKDMIAVVSAIYPKYDKTIQSKVEHGDEYGIQLRPDAIGALIERFAPERRKRPRKASRHKANRIYARLSDDVYNRLQQVVKANGDSIQDILESAVLQYIAQKGDHHDQAAK